MHFDKTSLSCLRGVLGSHWQLVTGERLTDKRGHYLLGLDSVTIGMKEGTLTFSSVETNLDFEDEDFSYDDFQVRKGDAALRDAVQFGDLEFKFANQTIGGITVVRERITRTSFGKGDWEFSTDFGVVFNLSEGAVAVFKGSHSSSGAIQVTFAESPDLIDVSDSTFEWTEGAELGEEYEVSREFIPIEDLLKPVGG